MALSQIDLGWAAGFIDGEGNIHISRKTPNPRRTHINLIYRLEMGAVNTKLPPILRLQSLFGGSVDTFTDKCEEKGHKIRHRWRVVDKEAEHCLIALLPNFSCKYEQAQLALEFRRVFRKHSCRLTQEQIQTRELFYQKMRILNGKGTISLTKGRQLQINEKLEKQVTLF